MPTDTDPRKTKCEQFQKAGILRVPGPRGSAGVRRLAGSAGCCLQQQGASAACAGCSAVPADAQVNLEGATWLVISHGLFLASVYGLWPLLSSRRCRYGQLLLKSSRNVSTLLAEAEKHPTALSVLNTHLSGIGCAKTEGSRRREMLILSWFLRLEGKLKLCFQPFL